MDISVIIINYNTFELTCSCITSVMEQACDYTYEVILVDNASTEIRSSAFLERFPSITLIESPVNVGFAKGNNLGILRAHGEYILLLNSDTVLKNDAIGICLSFLGADPSVAVVSGRLEYPDGQVQHNCQRFPSMRYKLFELFRLQKLLPKRVGGKILLGSFFDHNSVAYPDWVWGTFFMFDRALLKKLPGEKLADDFFMYVEDVQWCMDFRRLGYKVAFQPMAKILHYGGKSGGLKPELMHTNEKRFMHLYYSRAERFFIRILDRFLL